MLGEAPEGVDTTNAADAEAEDRLDAKLRTPSRRAQVLIAAAVLNRGRRRRVVRPDVAIAAADPPALRVHGGDAARPAGEPRRTLGALDPP